MPELVAWPELGLMLGARAHPPCLFVHGPGVRLAGTLGAEWCREGREDPGARHEVADVTDAKEPQGLQDICRVRVCAVGVTHVYVDADHLDQLRRRYRAYLTVRLRYSRGNNHGSDHDDKDSNYAHCFMEPHPYATFFNSPSPCRYSSTYKKGEK